MSNVYTTVDGFVTVSDIADLATVLKKCKNPDPQIAADQMNEIHFKEGGKKLPSYLWSAIVRLYFHFAKEKNSEVRVELYKHLVTNEWKVGVPKQEVTTTLCTNHDGTDVVDIITGEKFNPESDEFGAWYQFGTSHSHGKLSLSTFSGTDDADELGKEGPHILVSCINLETGKYVITGSVVWGGKRKYVDYNHLIDYDANDKTDFHPNCLEQVTEFDYRTYYQRAANKKWTGTRAYRQSWGGKYPYIKPQTTKQTPYSGYPYSVLDDEYEDELDLYMGPRTQAADPFYYSEEYNSNHEEALKVYETEMLTQDEFTEELENYLLTNSKIIKALANNEVQPELLKECFETAVSTLEFFLATPSTKDKLLK